MKSFLFGLICITLVMESCGSYYGQDNYHAFNKNYKTSWIQHESARRNTICSDGTFPAYRIDSIPYDSTKYMIIGKQANRLFLMPSDYLSRNKHPSYKELMVNCYGIIDYHLIFEADYIKGSRTSEIEHICDLSKIKCCSRNKRTYVFDFLVKPDYFIVYLFRGDTYNAKRRSILPSSYTHHVRSERHKFPQPSAYYKVFAPIKKKNN